MARSSARAEQRRKQKTRQGIVLLVFVVITIVAVGFVYFKASRNFVELDAKNCPKSGPTAYTAVLIDGTDSFNPIQHADLRRYFNRLKSEIRQFEQISIFAPRKLDQGSLLQLSLCARSNLALRQV